ncbi:MAG: flavodoxin domain-containing protein, partial [Aeromonadaceae bacterium]
MTSKGTQAAALPVPQLSKLAEAVAGFSAHELIWASGYLFGLAQAGGALAVDGSAGAAAVATAASAPAGTLTILYGSQTGNAKGVAESIKSQALGKGLQVQLLSMSDFKPKQLKKETHLIVVTSTLGE